MTKPRILIVDDEPRNLSLLEALLATFDVVIERASGGREAIEAFTRAAGGIDLVLLDVMMPEVDGLTALAAMREATSPEERVPILLVTALSAREDRMRGLEAGADDFLSKPLDPNEVRCRVRTFLALRAAQCALRQRAEELLGLQKSKAELTRMIVHDLKNPLAGVGSNLGWIERKLRKMKIEDDDLFEALGDARGGSTRLLSLITGLIDVEKAETGQLVVKPAPTKLDDLLRDVAGRHGKEAEAKAITIEVDVDPSLVSALDPELITRVLENLVENANRYTNAKGRIVLSAKKITGGVEIAVSNTGTPIPETLRAKVFDKNVSTEERGARGTNLGLGLYFCRLAALAHGGAIGVESTPEWPTRFFLRLAPAGAEASKPPASTTRPNAFLD